MPDLKLIRPKPAPAIARLVDDYLAHFDDICNLDDFLLPADSMEEVACRAEQLCIDFANPTLGNP